MGQSSSQQRRISSSSRRSYLRSPFSRKRSLKRASVSATFYLTDLPNMELLNINTADVEHLMTLPGVNRQIAQNIVDHRTTIGGRFIKIEDLALVSGIGAEKLEQIRPEICLRTKGVSAQSSNGSSTRSSLDLIVDEQNNNSVTMRSTPRQTLNINKATIFELQQVQGINQELAAKLIARREKRGQYKSLDDLLKVKGLSPARLGAIKTYLSVQDDVINRPLHKRQNSAPASTHARNYTRTANNNNNAKNCIIGKSLPVPIRLNGAAMSNSFSDSNLTNGLTNVPIHDIFELLTVYSQRPIAENSCRMENDYFNKIRVASWNLDRLCLQKSENLGVKEVICRTILENNLTIICVQEIVDPAALANICNELNEPVLKRVSSWRKNSRNWKYFVNETARNFCLNGVGFIYDAYYCNLCAEQSKEIKLTDCDTFVETADNISPPPPTAYLAAFKLSKWTCYVLNVYLKYFSLENIDSIVQSLTRQLEGRDGGPKIDDIYLVCGDFTGLKNGNNIVNSYFYGNNQGVHRIESSTRLNFNLENVGFYNLVDTNCEPQPSTPSVHPSINLPASSCHILCRDNLPLTKLEFRKKLYEVQPDTDLLNSNDISVPSAEMKLTGATGVIRTGLSHMAIPRFWGWGGPASDSHPLWCELYSEVDRSVTYKALTDKSEAKSICEIVSNGVPKSDTTTMQLSVVPAIGNGSMKF